MLWSGIAEMYEHIPEPARSLETMTVSDPPPIGLDARGQPRSSLFLQAIMRAGAEQAPVKVRNMSPNGAMVESALAPAPGTKVQLIRGVLLAQGTVIWSSNNRCGLRFSSELMVKEWLAAPTQAEQRRVDEIVALVKSGAVSPAPASSSSSGASNAPRSEEELVADLGAVVSLMQDLEDDLASSDVTLARHGVKLQNLDIAMQMIRAIANELTSARGGEPVSKARLEHLRVVCSQALGTP